MGGGGGNFNQVTFTYVLDNETDLEVDDDEEDSNSGHQVHQVGEVLSVEGLTQTPDLVGPGSEQVEQSNYGSLELSALASVDGGGRESFPDNCLTDVCSDKQRDTENQNI